MQLFEVRKDNMHFFSVDKEGTIWQMPRVKNGWEHRSKANGVKVEHLKELKVFTIQTPLADYVGVPADEAVESDA